MKVHRPLTVCISAAALAAAIPAVALQSSLAPMKLAVYEKPISFFNEQKQAISLGELPRGIKSMSAAACIECHPREHAQWKASGHARSVTEPVFAAAFKSEPRFLCRSCHSPLLEQHPLLNPDVPAVADSGAVISGPGPQTAQLPEPPAAGPEAPPATAAQTPTSPTSGSQPAQVAEVQVQQQLRSVFRCGGKKNPIYSEALANEGVTCVTCHVREGTVLTSLKTVSRKVPHALSYSPMLAKAELCAGCHEFNVASPSAHRFECAPAGVQQQAGMSGVPQQAPQPGAEVDSTDTNTDEPPVPSQPFLHSQYQQESRFQHSLEEFGLSVSSAKGGSCQTCHMPAEGKSFAHTWPGRSSVAMLQKAIRLSARLDRPAYRTGEKIQAVITVKNEAGHRFPTGDSLHAGILDVWLQDGKKTLGRQVFVMAQQSAPAHVLTNQIRTLSGIDGGFGGGSGGGVPTNLGLVRELGRVGDQVPQQQLSGLLRAPNSGPMDGLEAPVRMDTRLQPGEEAMFVFRQAIAGDLAKAKQPVLRIRVFHAGVHPGFKGSPIDPKLSPLRLVREQTLPVKIEAPEPPRQVAAAVTQPAAPAAGRP